MKISDTLGRTLDRFWCWRMNRQVRADIFNPLEDPNSPPHLNTWLPHNGIKIEYKNGETDSIGWCIQNFGYWYTSTNQEGIWYHHWYRTNNPFRLDDYRFFYFKNPEDAFRFKLIFE